MSALAPIRTEQTLHLRPADATGQLYERHSRRIFGYCLSLLGSREDAEDAVQTTFINAQRGLHRGVTPQFELAWLFKIARNVCYNTRASASRRGRLETVRDLDSLQDALATPERGAAISINELSKALESIPERQRHALLLREFQGLSYDEIAAELNVTVAAVETLIFRARRSVAEQLEQAGATRHVGAFVSIVAFLRWLFPGAAKVAAVAATATLAVTPGMRGPDRAAVSDPIIPVRGAATAPVADTGVTSMKPRPAVSGDLPVAPKRLVAVASESAPAAATPTDVPSAPVQETSAGSPGTQDIERSQSAPPLVNTDPLPEVAPPTITIPPVVDVALPPLELPQVELPPLPVEVPQLPPVELPKLP